MQNSEAVQAWIQGEMATFRILVLVSKPENEDNKSWSRLVRNYYGNHHICHYVLRVSAKTNEKISFQYSLPPLTSISNSSFVLFDFQKARSRSQSFRFYDVCVLNIWDLKLPAHLEAKWSYIVSNCLTFFLLCVFKWYLRELWSEHA